MSSKRAVQRGRSSKAAPLRVLPCTAANLRRAARAVSQVYDDQLRAVGLTIAQFTLIQTLTLAGKVTQRRLGEILVLDSTTLSRTLRPLEQRGWIRRRSGKDRRERQIELTEAGRSLFRAAISHWNRAQKRVSARLGRRWIGLMRELSAIADLTREA
jgi:DNA-binding MarR family transcriptional regulator